jgi:hypothetical protein
MRPLIEGDRRPPALQPRCPPSESILEVMVQFWRAIYIKELHRHAEEIPASQGQGSELIFFAFRVRTAERSGPRTVWRRGSRKLFKKVKRRRTCRPRRSFGMRLRRDISATSAPCREKSRRCPSGRRCSECATWSDIGGRGRFCSSVRPSEQTCDHWRRFFQCKKFQQVHPRRGRRSRPTLASTLGSWQVRKP